MALSFPPGSSGGVPRMARLCQFLSGRGWDIRVLTVTRNETPDPMLHPGDAVVTRLPQLGWGRTDQGLLHALSAPVRALTARRDRRDDRLVIGESPMRPSYRRMAWLPLGVAAGLVLLARGRPHVLAASLPPATAGVTARLLHALSGVPLVIDYRDPWSIDPEWAYDRCGRPRRDPWTRLRLRVERALESWVLRGACAVGHAGGPGLAGDFAVAFPAVPRDRYTHVPNGFSAEDAADLPEAAHRPEGEPFLLTFVGVYDGLHTPNLFLRGLARHVERYGTPAERLRVHFIGHVSEASLELAASLGLDRYVEVRAPVQRRESLAAMRSADALLTTLPPLPFSRHWIPTKVYEYLQAGRPILAVVPPGATADLVRRVPSSVVADPLDPDAIAGALQRLVTGPAPRRAVVDLDDCDRRHACAAFERLLDACRSRP